MSRVGRLDLGKVQMFYFTVTLVLVSGAAVARAVATIGLQCASGPPEVSPSIVTLLGISHAGYLANNAVPEKEVL